MMAGITQRWERSGCRPLASGSGALAAAQPISNTAPKACMWSIPLLQDIVLEVAVYIFLCVCVLLDPKQLITM